MAGPIRVPTTGSAAPSAAMAEANSTVAPPAAPSAIANDRRNVRSPRLMLNSGPTSAPSGSGRPSIVRPIDPAIHRPARDLARPKPALTWSYTWISAGLPAAFHAGEQCQAAIGHVEMRGADGDEQRWRVVRNVHVLQRMDRTATSGSPDMRPTSAASAVPTATPPPAENPMMPTRVGSIFHCLAFLRTSRRPPVHRRRPSAALRPARHCPARDWRWRCGSRVPVAAGHRRPVGPLPAHAAPARRLLQGAVLEHERRDALAVEPPGDLSAIAVDGKHAQGAAGRDDHRGTGGDGRIRQEHGQRRVADVGNGALAVRRGRDGLGHRPVLRARRLAGPQVDFGCAGAACARGHRASGQQRQ